MKLSIRTDFYRGHKIIRVNHAKWASKAVPHAVEHMQSGRYDASHCEVYDTATGELHAVLRMPKGGMELVIIYKRNPSEVDHGNA